MKPPRSLPIKLLTLSLTISAALSVQAQDRPVNIDHELASVTVPLPDGGEAEINRIQDNQNKLEGDWARTSRPCPNFCIQPMSPADGVVTIGELELLELLADPEAVVIDSRTVDWYQGGTIPGSVSIPYTQILDELGQLGCEPDFEGWDCTEAKSVALFCNGLWCGQSPTAIRNMIEGGYPPERIHYYRGGMQSWRLLGLTVTGEKD